VGVAVGVAASWKFFKTKYEQIAQNEIDDVKEYYRGFYSASESAEEVPDAPVDDKAYEKIANQYSTESTSVKIEEKSVPYVIPPEELGDVEEYDTTTLYYYQDGILVTLEDEVVEDVVGTVGNDFESHFGEYEDDSVCVRNDSHKCDYEILKDSRRYADVKKPARPQEVEE
jgi:hypothetical protein